jgi:hypothetical protein
MPSHHPGGHFYIQNASLFVAEIFQLLAGIIPVTLRCSIKEAVKIHE